MSAAEQAVADKLRKIFKKLPGVTEERDGHGHLTFKVAKKSLAILGLHDDQPSLGVKTDFATQSALVKRHGFYITPYVGQHGWASFDGNAKQFDWAIIEEVITDTYRSVAPKKLLKELDE